MDPVFLVQNIYKLVTAIKAQVEKVKANQQQCQRLAARIGLFSPHLGELKKRKDSAAFRADLANLESYLQQALNVLIEYSTKSSLQRLWGAGGDKERFAQLNQDLAEATQQLQFGVSAQHFLNAIQDREDQQADVAALKQQQTEILLQNQKVLQAVGQQPQIIEAIIGHQLGSIKRRLNLLALPPTEAKSETKATPLSPPIEEQIACYELVFEQPLAKGNYGQVFQGQWSGQAVAIRWHTDPLSVADMELFTQKAQRLLQLRHPGLLPCYGVVTEPPHAGWVLPFHPDSQLSTLLPAASMTLAQRKKCGSQLLAAITYLHQKKLVHGHITPPNLFLMADKDEWQLKLSEPHTTGMLSPSLSATRQLWLAPECRLGAAITPASDVYQTAVVLAALISNQLPHGQTSLKDQYGDAIALLKDAAAKRLFETTLVACWSDNPTQRPTLAQLSKAYHAYQNNQLEPPATPRGPSPQTLEPASDFPIGEEKEKKKAMAGAQFFQPAEAEKTPVAWYNLGQAYQYGDGVGKNLTEAVRCYQKAAAKQHPAAMCELGMAYFQGEGAEKDPDRAFGLFQLSAPAHGKSTFMLGYCHERGRGAPQDYKKALSYYRQATQQGYDKAKTRYQQVAAHLGLPDQLEENAAATIKTEPVTSHVIH